MLRTVVSFGTLTLCFLLLPLAAFAGGGIVQAGDVLASTGNADRDLIRINPATGAASFVADLGQFGPVTSLDYRRDGVLFATTGARSNALITIDPASGVETQVASLDGRVTAIAFIDDVLYGIRVEQEEGFGVELVTIDQSTGVITRINDLAGWELVRGLAYDESSGILYGTGFPIARLGGGEEELFEIDPSNASTTRVGSTDWDLGFGGLAFGLDGTLYAGDVGDGGGDDLSPTGVQPSFWTIDLTTGEATQVGETGFPAIAALAVVPGGGSAQEIPTLSLAGLLALLLLLGGVGLFVLRRS